MPQDNNDAQVRPDEAQAARVTAAAEALTRQLERENAALKAGDFNAVKGMQADKAKLGSAFEQEFACLKREAGGMLKDPAIAPRALIQAVQAFHAALTENGRMLLRFKSISEGMVGAISAEAAAKDPGVNRYGSDAALTGRNARKAPPLALNQII